MTRFGVEPEYVALVDPDTFRMRETLARAGLLVIAARIGAVRLIDNALLMPAGTPSANPGLAGKVAA